jgi:hypothetical protein
MKMKLIDGITKLDSDLSESSAQSNLMENFPLICKKDPIKVQIHFIKDHYETYGRVIRLDDILEEMYGGALPVSRSRKSKRKVTSKEEYLEVEKPSKKAKKEKASDKLKIGGSGLPSIEEEVQDLDTYTVLTKRTRSGKATTSTQVASDHQATPDHQATSDQQVAPDQPSIPKKKKKSAIRKMKESIYVIEEAKGSEAASEMVTR